jgi:hypothetical protein
MADIKALIAKQRAELEVENRSELDVVLGGEIVTLSIERVHPDVWDTLMGDNPPRAGVEGDSVMGYNPKGVSASYPNVMVDGEVMDPETWAEMYSVLDSRSNWSSGASTSTPCCRRCRNWEKAERARSRACPRTRRFCP